MAVGRVRWPLERTPAEFSPGPSMAVDIRSQRSSVSKHLVLEPRDINLLLWARHYGVGVSGTMTRCSPDHLTRSANSLTRRACAKSLTRRVGAKKRHVDRGPAALVFFSAKL